MDVARNMSPAGGRKRVDRTIQWSCTNHLNGDRISRKYLGPLDYKEDDARPLLNSYPEYDGSDDVLSAGFPVLIRNQARQSHRNLLR